MSIDQTSPEHPVSLSCSPAPGPNDAIDPAGEAERLDALQRTGLLDSAPEQAYDEITELAASICDVPIAYISLVDSARQWFKSVKGLPCQQTPRKGSVCTFTIRHNSPLVIPDLAMDPRFQQSPFVTNMGFRFYAGVPIRNEAGVALGSLCVVDYVSRNLSEPQLRALRSLAHQVETQIALREKLNSLEIAEGKTRVLTGQLAASEAQFRAFMDHNPAASFIKDADGRMLYCNRSFADTFNATPESFLGKLDEDLWPREQAAAFHDADSFVLRNGQQIELEERVDQPGAPPIFFKTYKFPIRDASGELCLAGVALNISSEKRYAEELRAANARLEALVMLDPLTALGNRRALDVALEQNVSAATHSHQHLGLLLLDVDHFKRLNDTFGHARGDDALRRIGEVLRRIIRRVDHVCRFGGEEFAIVVPNTTIDSLLALGERVRAEIADIPFDFGQVTVSIGAALLAPSAPDPSTLLAGADRALYTAKREGRNRVLLAA